MARCVGVGGRLVVVRLPITIFGPAVVGDFVVLVVVNLWPGRLLGVFFFFFRLLRFGFCVFLGPPRGLAVVVGNFS